MENINKDLPEDYGLTEEERLALEENEPEESETGTEEIQDQPEEKEEQQEQESRSEESNIREEKQGNPILVASSVDGIQEKLAEISTQKDELHDQFDNGDLTAKEYQKQLDALNKEERKLEFQVHESQMAEKLEAQRVQNEWKTLCDSFLASNPTYKENARLYKLLDDEVKTLAVDPKTAGWTGLKILQEAHNNIYSEFSGSFKNQSAARKQDIKLPPNLSKIPSADIESTDGGRFAVLDRLATADPIEYENALAKMSDSDRNAYLSS